MVEDGQLMEHERVDFSKYIVISIWFGCNNNCTICMLSGLKRMLPATGFEDFKRILSSIKSDGRFENLILSGAEVTTFNDLAKFAQYAASLNYFDKIQIQTNGRKLKDRAYLERLIKCGVNEFFVSIHGLDDIHDASVRTKGAFQETKAGLLNLAEYDVNVITNTVLTKANFHGVPQLLAFLAQGSASEIHLWNYFPMERFDSRDLVVSMKDFTKLFPELAAIGRTMEKTIVLKSFPECLSVGPNVFFDCQYPETVLPDRFWREFSECGFGQCVYKDRCKAFGCWGLSSAYIEKYGDERDLLRPIGG